MEITSLTDHVKTTTGTAITTEWGLSLHLKRNNVSMLFDMASSGHFMDNAAALGIDIYSVDLAVLSHGTTTMAAVCETFLLQTRRLLCTWGRGSPQGFLSNFRPIQGQDKQR